MALTAAAVVVALVASGTAAWVLLHRKGSASFNSSQPYPTTAVASTAHSVAQQQSRAAQLMTGWWRAHGAQEDDQGFAQWLRQNFPRPPARATRAHEAASLMNLAKSRTSSGIAAAQYLDDHGADDIWKTYAQRLSTSGQGPGTTEMDDLTDFAGQVAGDLQTQDAALSPYVILPALRTDKPAAASGGDCVCSYPSTHATDSAAAREYLTFFDPHSVAYVNMEAQVDYSRLYVAGPVPSDITARALLGDMIGEYFLVTRDSWPRACIRQLGLRRFRLGVA
ncbi:MAG: hypothetical protein ACR2FG_12370, partial [Marmoricola sp.]